MIEKEKGGARLGGAMTVALRVLLTANVQFLKKGEDRCTLRRKNRLAHGSLWWAERDVEHILSSNNFDCTFKRRNEKKRIIPFSSSADILVQRPDEDAMLGVNDKRQLRWH